MSDPISDGVVVDAVVEETRAASRQGRSRFYIEREGFCSNCGTKLRGRICHSCGQDSDSFHRPIWSLLWEVLDGLGGADGRLWRTVPALMFRPGYLTKQYLEGVRARYVQPFRLYLLASVLFFLLSGLSSLDWSSVTRDAEQLSENQIADASETLEAIAESNPELAAELELAARELERVRTANGSSTDESDAEVLVDAITSEANQEQMIDRIRRSLVPEDHGGDLSQNEQATGDETMVIPLSESANVSFDPGPLSALPLAMRRQLADQFERVINEPGRLFEGMARSLPTLLFFLLPIYALVLSVGQIWRGRFYFYDHLIVSLHFHAYLFLMFTLLLIASPIISGWSFLIFLIWSNYYLYRLHRVIYQHGRFMSAVRTLTLDLTYLIVIALASPVLLLVGLLAA